MTTQAYRAFGMSRTAYNFTRCMFWMHTDSEWMRMARQHAGIIIAGEY
jgi:hypothetical protein